MKVQIRFLFLILLLISTLGMTVHAGDKIEVSKEFNLFTSKNLEGYMKPFFTSIEESINANLFSNVYLKDCWSVGLDISVSGMFIPNSQMTFDAERPEDFGNTGIVRTAERREGQTLKDYTDDNIQPTIYGGHSTAIFAARQNPWYPDSMNKTVGYVEGNDISFMAGLPALQLTVGLPSRTEVRVRFLMLNVSGEPLTYWGVSLAQQIDQFFGLFDPEKQMALSVYGAYAKATRDASIDMGTYSLGAAFSKTMDFGLTFYAGLQYENMTGTFEATRDKEDAEEYNDSPYEEIRNLEDINVDITSFNKFRGLLGIAYQIGMLELHADAAWASQPILTAGITFTFGEWGASKDLERERKKKEELGK